MRRRTYLFAGLIAAVLVAVAAAWRFTLGAAQPPEDPEHAPGKNLPLTQVILFNSGVGYFQREGDVEGDARVDLPFPSATSTICSRAWCCRTSATARSSTVSYDSQEPVEKTLKSFAIDLTNNPTLGQILNQARGEKIEVVLAAEQRRPAGHADRRHRRHGGADTSPAPRTRSSRWTC